MTLLSSSPDGLYCSNVDRLILVLPPLLAYHYILLILISVKDKLVRSKAGYLHNVAWSYLSPSTMFYNVLYSEGLNPPAKPLLAMALVWTWCEILLQNPRTWVVIINRNSWCGWITGMSGRVVSSILSFVFS